MGQMNDYFWAINKNLKRKINEKNKLAKDIEDFIYFSREWVNYYNKINDQDKKAQYEDMFELCKQIGTMNRAFDDCFSDLLLKDKLLPRLQIYTYIYDNNGFNKKKQKKCEKVIDQWMDMVSQIEKEIDYISESCIQAMQPIESKKIETRNQELYKARENEYKASRERIINLYNRLAKDFFMQYKASKIRIDPNEIYEVADLISYMDILEKNNELHKKHKEYSQKEIDELNYLKKELDLYEISIDPTKNENGGKHEYLKKIDEAIVECEKRKEQSDKSIIRNDELIREIKEEGMLIGENQNEQKAYIKSLNDENTVEINEKKYNVEEEFYVNQKANFLKYDIDKVNLATRVAYMENAGPNRMYNKIKQNILDEEARKGNIQIDDNAYEDYFCYEKTEELVHYREILEEDNSKLSKLICKCSDGEIKELQEAIERTRIFCGEGTELELDLKNRLSYLEEISGYIDEITNYKDKNDALISKLDNKECQLSEEDVKYINDRQAALNCININRKEIDISSFTYEPNAINEKNKEDIVSRLLYPQDKSTYISNVDVLENNHVTIQQAPEKKGGFKSTMRKYIGGCFGRK